MKWQQSVVFEQGTRPGRPYGSGPTSEGIERCRTGLNVINFGQSWFLLSQTAYINGRKRTICSDWNCVNLQAVMLAMNL